MERIDPLKIVEAKLQNKAEASQVMVACLCGGPGTVDIPVQVDVKNRICLPITK